MKFAVIAAGEGSRLTGEGAVVPKPLTKVNGETLIDRLLRIFSSLGAEETVLIVNTITSLVGDYIRANYNILTDDGKVVRCPRQPLAPVPVRLVEKTTKSSLHSFYEISKYLRSGRFCLTTVDTVFHEDDFLKYINYVRTSRADGVMAVTSYIDDEKPLYVGVDADMNITGFYDNDEGYKYVSGGIYSLNPQSLDILERCVSKGVSRMRNFQRQLVAEGLALKAYNFEKIVDVDHISDIDKAENFLRENETC